MVEQDIKLKHFKGWMTPHNMTNPDWLVKWREVAEKAKSEGMAMCVFAIPKDKDSFHLSALIRQIELLLQNDSNEKDI